MVPFMILSHSIAYLDLSVYRLSQVFYSEYLIVQPIETASLAALRDIASHF